MNTTDIDSLIEEILVDAYGEDEQLWAFRQTFEADDLQKAFEKVGYPPMDHNDDAFFENARKVIDALVDRKKRDMLARRLVCMLPDYVAAGRHLDAWILQHNAILLDEPPEDACGPFLLCMFMHGMREWDEKRDHEQLDMFRHLGIDPEDIRRGGFEGIEPFVQAMMTDKNKTAEMQKFLNAHPELKALTEAQCRESEDAALRLVRREDAESLLLAPDEIVPWLPVFEERMTKNQGMRQAMQGDAMPDEKAQKALADLMYSICSEMAGEIFTKSRLDQLMDAIHTYRRGLEPKDREGMTGVNEALMLAQSLDPASKNHFLTMLCYTSFTAFVDTMHKQAEA